RGHGRPVVGRWLDGGNAAQWIGSNRAILVSGVLIVSLFAVTFVGSNRIELNDQYSKYFSEDLEFRRDTDFARSRLNGIINIDFNIESSGQTEVIAPAALGEVEAFANWLRTQPSVTYVHSPVNLFKKLNQNFHNDDERYFSIPDTREMVAQYLLILELSLPRGQDTSNFITLDKSAIKLSAITSDLTAAESRELRVAAENWFRQNSAVGLTAEGMSTHLMFAYVSQNNIEGMLRGVPLALLGIAMILGWSFHSFWIGAAALISITLPIAASFGIWGLLYGQIGTAAAVVAAVAVGIVVDDTVHFLTRYHDAKATDLSNRESSIKALRRSGPAIITSSLILTLGFFILSFSTFKVNQNMGGLMVIVTVVALIFVLIILASIFAAQTNKITESKNAV
ncbi:MAG: MMPL family transporter, partial [Henriciella sp.]|nr:MMPL family transporter [Henriciella sp.]